MTDCDIICISPNQWDGIWRRRHHLMSRFARHNRVLFVEPAQFWGVIQEEGAKVRTEAGRLLYRAQDNLYVQRLINLLPFAESAAELGINIVRWANEIVCRMEVKRAVHQLGFREPILWAYNRPDTRRILAAVEPHLVCYDVFDKYSEMPHLSARGRVEAQKLHEWLLARADVVFVASPLLYKECLQERSDAVYMVQNGADLTLFAEGVQGRCPLSEDIASLPRPIIGYVGALFDKVDFSLLNALSESVPDCSLVFIGPVRIHDSYKRRSWSQLLERHNVFYLGKRSRPELSGYWQAIDVGLIPYDSTNYGRYGDPNKMYEYQAAGVPVVASGIAVADPYSEVVYGAQNPAEFIERICILAFSDNSALIQRGKELAAHSSWDARMKEMSRILESHLRLQSSCSTHDPVIDRG